MKLIKDLGVVSTSTRKQKLSTGLYECPLCLSRKEYAHRAIKRTKHDICRQCYCTTKHKHGLSRSSIYSRYMNMIQRCTNENSRAWDNYGGRGIRNMFSSFEEYFEHVSSLEDYLVDGFTLDRIDNDGNYEIGNLKWSTKREQSINRRVPKNNTGIPFISYSDRDKAYRISMLNSKNRQVKELDVALKLRMEDRGF